MRLRFFLCASADLGVRRSNVASSFCRSGYIEVLREDSGGPLPGGGPLVCPGGRSRPGWYTNCTLEKEFQCKLHQPWVLGLGHLAELRTIRTAPVGVEELGMVKDVEELATEIDALF